MGEIYHAQLCKRPHAIALRLKQPVVEKVFIRETPLANKTCVMRIAKISDRGNGAYYFRWWSKQSRLTQLCTLA
ncbi:MAG: hypothetical protein WCJ75_08180 [Desulfomonile sp.]|jgi:hypothetical protein